MRILPESLQQNDFNAKENMACPFSTEVDFQHFRNSFDWHISLLGVNDAYRSPAFALRGYGPCYLHFMPYVSDCKNINGDGEGYGGLYLEAPNGCGLRFVLCLGSHEEEFEGHWTARQRWQGACLFSSRAEVIRSGVAHGFHAHVEVLEDLGSLKPLGCSGVEWTIPEATALMQEKKKGEAIITRYFHLDHVRNLRLRLYPMGDKACSEGHAAVHVEAPVGSKFRYTLKVGRGARVWKQTTDAVFKTSRLGCGIGPLQLLCSREGALTIRLESLSSWCIGTVGIVEVVPTAEISFAQTDDTEMRVEWVIENAREVLLPLRRGQYVRSEVFDAGEEDPWQLVLFPRANLGCEKLPGNEPESAKDYACHHPRSNLGSLYLQSVKTNGHSPLPDGLTCRWFAGEPDRSTEGKIVDNILIRDIDMEPGRGFEDEEATTLRKTCASHGVHEVCNFFDFIDRGSGALTVGLHVSGHLKNAVSTAQVQALAARLQSFKF